MLAEMHSLTVAGHETTSNTLTWMLYELAQRPELQARIRAEIRAARAAVIERGDYAFSLEDLDSMKVVLATIKVSRRSVLHDARTLRPDASAVSRKRFVSTPSSTTCSALQPRTTSSRSLSPLSERMVRRSPSCLFLRVNLWYCPYVDITGE